MEVSIKTDRKGKEIAMKYCPINRRWTRMSVSEARAAIAIGSATLTVSAADYFKAKRAAA